MPFATLSGIPRDTPDEVLLRLRRDIVTTIQKEMNVPAKWVGVFMPKDMLPDPALDGSEGANTIYIRLDTGLYHGKPDAGEQAHRVATKLAEVVWGAFGCLREVECMVSDFDPEWKALIKAIM